jgi:hypothetical protein
VIIQHLANLPSSCPSDSSSLESCISALKSSISALESFLKTTEGSSGHWETFGWLCAIAVGVGIAGEIVVIVSEHFEGLEDWERGIIRPPDRPPEWRFWFDIVATLIVLGGVFGEAGATAEVASVNSQLRSKTSELRAKSDQLVAVITEEAGSAAKSAKIAHDEASAVKGIADEARADAKDALVKAQEAQRELGNTEADAAKAQTAASRAQEKVEAVAKRAAQIRSDVEAIAPRVLTLEQQRQIGGACLAFRGHNVSVFSYAGDGEGAALGGQIITAFTGRGINVVDTRASSMSLGGFDFGIHVRGPDGELPFMYCLKDALDFIGHLEVAPVNDPLPPRIGATVHGGGQSFIPGTVYVTIPVGIKPVPLLSDATAQPDSTNPK